MRFVNQQRVPAPLPHNVSFPAFSRAVVEPAPYAETHIKLKIRMHMSEIGPYFKRMVIENEVFLHYMSEVLLIRRLLFPQRFRALSCAALPRSAV